MTRQQDQATVHVDRAILLVHDVVNDFLTPSDRGTSLELSSMLSNIRLLLSAARAAEVPVSFIAPGRGNLTIEPSSSTNAPGRLIWGSSGVDVPADLGPLAGDRVIRKPRYGAFYGSELHAYMRAANRDTLIVCGISLAGGVETTIRDAFNRDLNSILVSDACLCRPISDQGWGMVSRAEVAKVTLSILAQRFADVLTTEAVCKKLSREG